MTQSGQRKFEPIPQRANDVAAQVVDAAFRVHAALGPGLLESVYSVCLVYELRKRGVRVVHDVTLPVNYDDIELQAGLMLDLVAEDCVVVEIKAVDTVLPVHHAQVITYLKLTGYRLGLLINFNTALIKDGIKRFVV
jgi:GxxExxY protein